MTGNIYIQPKNTMPEIKELWAFLSVDPKDENEGVCAGMIMGAWMPLIAADETRLKDLEPIAHQIAHDTGIKIKLVKFTTREEIKEIT